MAQLPNQQNSDSTSRDHKPQPLTTDEWFLWFAWALIVVGFFLVAFAGPLGLEFSKERLSGSSYGWNPEKVREASTTVRTIGLMCFASGLVERLIIQLSKLKSQ